MGFKIEEFCSSRSCCACSVQLIPNRYRRQISAISQSVVQGLRRAKDVGILDWHLPESTFDLKKYEHYEQVLNGDFNWILPGKLLAFSGPTSSSREHSAYGTLGVLDYVSIFRQEGISAVVRLNKAVRTLPHLPNTPLPT